MFNLKGVPNVHEKILDFIMPSIGKMIEIYHYYMHKLNEILNTLKILGESGRKCIIGASHLSLFFLKSLNSLLLR